MAEETKQTTSETTPVPVVSETTTATPVVVVSDKLETPVEKDLPPQPEPEPESDNPVVVEKEEEKAVAADESASFKEESNKVDDLIDPEKKALDEFKLLIQEALNTHQFTTPPPPPPPKEEPKKEEPKKEEETPVVEKEEPKSEEEPKIKEEEVPKTEACEPVVETPAVVEPTKEEEVVPPAAAAPEVKVDVKIETSEDIKETIVHEVTTPTPAVETEQCIDAEKTTELETAAEPEAVVEPEEISIWGIPLLADERSDVILLKFLRARDFKVKEAFSMLKSVVAWRKEFKIDELLNEEIKIEGLEKVVFMNGVDKEGHPVCYNCFGEFQDKDLYGNCIADAEKRTMFLRWYIQLLEKNVRGLDFTPKEGNSCTIVQITDLKNSPGLILFKKELRQATNQALQLLQDNYPEFVAKQLFVNVPWWYVAYNRMISPLLTQRTKSKFVYAGPTKTAETLFKYIAPEQVPVQYGGLSKEGEAEFTSSDAATEEIIKPACKHTVEFPVTEAGTLLWEARVIGWDVSYGAEFVPSEEGAYTLIVQKARKIGPADELSISCTFKTSGPGKVVLTFDNQTSKKKKLLYRSKAI